MQFLIGFIVSTISGLLKWIIKKLGISKGVVAVQIFVAGAYYAFLFSAVLFIVDFVFRLWDMVRNVMQSLNQMNVSGQAYGISLETILQNVWGFMNAAGITDALIAAGDLFIALLSIYFTIKMYQLFVALTKEVYTIITHTLNLLTA